MYHDVLSSHFCTRGHLVPPAIQAGACLGASKQASAARDLLCTGGERENGTVRTWQVPSRRNEATLVPIPTAYGTTSPRPGRPSGRLRLQKEHPGAAASRRRREVDRGAGRRTGRNLALRRHVFSNASPSASKAALPRAPRYSGRRLPCGEQARKCSTRPAVHRRRTRRQGRAYVASLNQATRPTGRRGQQRPTGRGPCHQRSFRQ